MKQILLDTNFLMIPGTLNVDIFSEIDRIIHEPYSIEVIDTTLEELEKIIKEKKGRYKIAAKLGLALVRHKGLKIIPKAQLPWVVMKEGETVCIQ